MPVFKPARGIFITATDTGVGKTWVAAHLLRALRQRGMQPQVFKPVESGCGDDVTTHDAEILRVAADLPDIRSVRRFQLKAPVAPALAAQRENVAIHLQELIDFCRSDAEVRVVEGAGGWRVPVAEDGEIRDLAAALGLPVLVVAADRLGAVNHVLLTCEAIRRTPACRLGGVVLNSCTPESEDVGNAQMLAPCLEGVPLWQTPHQQWLGAAQEEALLEAFGLLDPADA